jgi:divalent metal cation (Fe/Co/Zn/Cd) transporter
MMAPMSQAVGSSLRRRALVLEWTTIAWNAGEVFVTIGLGVAARSLALVAFGLDAVVEVFASVVVVWHVGRVGRTSSPARTRRALRLVAVAFAALAVLLTVGVVRVIASGHRADTSPWGIAYLAMTAAVMFGLAIAKRRTAVGLDSQPLAAEATLTRLDGALATSILLALAANAALGWWWADPVATLLIAAVAAREARENWEADILG